MLNPLLLVLQGARYLAACCHIVAVRGKRLAWRGHDVADLDESE